MLKLKLQYFGHLMQRTDSLGKTLILRKNEDRKRRGWQRTKDGWMASPTQWIRIWASSESWWWTGRPGVLQSMGSQSQTWLSDWTEQPLHHEVSGYWAILREVLTLECCFQNSLRYFKAAHVEKLANFPNTAQFRILGPITHANSFLTCAFKTSLRYCVTDSKIQEWEWV